MHQPRISLSAPILAVRLVDDPPADAPPAANAAPPPSSQREPSAPSPPPRPAVDPALALELTQTLCDRLAAIEERRRQSLRELQTAAIELAVAATSQLIARAVGAGDYGLQALIVEAVERLGLTQALTVFLHPEDLAAWRAAQPPETIREVESRCLLKTDPRLGRGDCRIETAEGLGLLYDVGAQLSELRQHWLEGLDDAPTERRRTDAEGRPLKRFPDRRETA